VLTSSGTSHYQPYKNSKINELPESGEMKGTAAGLLNFKNRLIHMLVMVEYALSGLNVPIWWLLPVFVFKMSGSLYGVSGIILRMNVGRGAWL
jgi:hypothetical protein